MPVMDDMELVSSIVVYTDGSASPTGEWPWRCAKAGWALVVCARPAGAQVEHVLGAAFGPVVIQADNAGYMQAERCTAPRGDIGACCGANPGREHRGQVQHPLQVGLHACHGRYGLQAEGAWESWIGSFGEVLSGLVQRAAQCAL